MPHDRQLIEIKYKSPAFGAMPEIALQKAVKVLLLKLHVITGWPIPEAELKNILVDQLQKKMVESYSNVNVDEVEYAFRNSHGVEDYGKSMNLDLIGKVMNAYLEKRRVASDLEERAAPVTQKLDPVWYLDLLMASRKLASVDKLPKKVVKAEWI